MNERRVGGEPEHGARYFDGANTFEEIFSRTPNAPQGKINENSLVAFMAARASFIKGDIVKTIPHISRAEGFREAVIRALTPSFEGMRDVGQIIARLRQVEEQDSYLPTGNQGEALSIFKTDSGEPIKIQNYLHTLEYISSFLRDASNPDRAQIVKKAFNDADFTPTGGFKKAVEVAIIFGLANADTGPVYSG